MRKFFGIALFLAGILSSVAQQALWNQKPIMSPEILPDRTVTFRLIAPEAVSVVISGDFLPLEGAVMTKDENGVWTYTTPKALQPELYMYSFIVDGVRMNDPANVFMIRDVATVTNIFLVDSIGSRANLYAVNDVPHGMVSRVWYDSPGLGMQRRMTVYTPPGYENGNESYPVLYLLHGAGGDEEAWINLGRASQILDNLIAQGKAQPMIVVMTNGNATQSAAPGESALGFVQPTFDVSRMNKGEFESSFPEIVGFIDSHYRTKTDKAHRAIAGLSMGGFHSLHISKQYPDLFDYIGLFSAAIFPSADATSEVYTDFEEKLNTQFEKNPKLYWIAIGESDFLYEPNVAFRRILDNNNYPYEYYENSDGHIWKNWRIYLAEFLPKLFKD